MYKRTHTEKKYIMQNAYTQTNFYFKKNNEILHIFEIKKIP